MSAAILPFRRPSVALRPTVTYLAALVYEEKARHDYLGARALREVMDGTRPEVGMYDETHQAFDAWRDLAERMAMTPSADHDELSLKKIRLGVWLTAKGDFYDRLRAAVERDQKVLGPGRRSRR